jgi:hypothetical protein
MNTQTLADSYDVYKQTHEKHPDYFAGFSIMEYVFEIGELIKHSNITSAIDYGCGKARAWSQYNLQQLWKLHQVTFFDPGVEQYAIKPYIPRDLVICTDVMEHVPEHLVDEVLADINHLAKKAIFLNISTRPASKILVDGTNAHATVKPAPWWQKKLDAIDKLVIVHYTS